LRTSFCCLVKYLAYSVDTVSNRSAIFLLIVNQVDRIKQLQVVNLALYVQHLLVVQAMAYYCQVDIWTGTVVALRPGAEKQYFLNVGMPPEYIAKLVDDSIP